MGLNVPNNFKKTAKIIVSNQYNHCLRINRCNSIILINYQPKRVIKRNELLNKGPITPK